MGCEQEDPWAIPPTEFPRAFSEIPDSIACPVSHSACELLDQNDTTYCLCSLDNLEVPVEQGDGWPGDPGGWLDPLIGWPPEDVMGWEILPGEGPQGPEHQGCDFPSGACDMDVELACTTNVLRGEEARCTFSVSEPLDAVYGWTFTGDQHLTVSLGMESPPRTRWSGTVVESGHVRVDYKAGGRDSSFIRSRINVTSRTGSEWIWEDGSGIDKDKDGLTFPAGDSAVAKVCHAENGCGAGSQYYLVQPQDVQHGVGYFHDQITDGGPNDGAWWIQAVTVDVKMASAKNPDYISGGTPYPAEGCLPDMLSFYQFNQVPCGGDGGTEWAGMWLDWVDDHEDQHMAQPEQFINQSPGTRQVPAVLEELALPSASELQDEVEEVVTESGFCTTSAATLHYSQSHPKPTFAIWFWKAGPAEWQDWNPSDPPWWPENPVPPECF